MPGSAEKPSSSLVMSGLANETTGTPSLPHSSETWPKLPDAKGLYEHSLLVGTAVLSVLVAQSPGVSDARNPEQPIAETFLPRFAREYNVMKSSDTIPQPTQSSNRIGTISIELNQSFRSGTVVPASL